MSEDLKLSVTEVLEDLYKNLDSFAEKQTQRVNVTCKKGCDSCCYLLAMATFAEGILIAERLLSKPDWQALLPKLRVSSLHHDYAGVSKESYFSKKYPCVFLDTTERTCTIYEIRPAACRYHFVVSPPEKCSPDDKEGETAILDLVSLEGEVWKFSKLVEDQVLKVGVPLIAPIPLMVLYCMELISRDDKKVNDVIRLACRNVPSPLSWLRAHLETIMKDGSGRKANPSLAELAKVMGG